MPSSWNLYVKDPNSLNKLTGNEKGEIIYHIKYLWDNFPENFDDCVKLALDRFHNNFAKKIGQLLNAYPKDSLTSSNQPFWTAGKRCPHVINFDKNNELHYKYIYHTSLLIAEMFNIESGNINSVIENYEEPTLKFDKTIISTSDKEEKEKENNKYLKMINVKLPEIELMREIKINVIEFEKDDDMNHHIDFINCTSNLRATNYDIEPVDRLKTKLIAGKIIPAISTTTSIVSGLVSIEMLKYIFGKREVKYFKDTFFNLALSFIGQSDPMECESFTLNNRRFTKWDYIDINENVKVSDLFNKLEILFNIKIDTLIYQTKC